MGSLQVNWELPDEQRSWRKLMEVKEIQFELEPMSSDSNFNFYFLINKKFCLLFIYAKLFAEPKGR